jgi:transposase InsO family protein
VSHPNARLTPLTRRELVRQVAVGWPQAEVARQFRVSRATVAKWVRRYREAGEAGLLGRSSAPHRHPRRTPPEVEQRICGVRRSQGFGPHRIAWALGLARSTVYAVLRRSGLNRLDRMHRVTREVIRYEHPLPGGLLHLDVKKSGRVPVGGGKRFAPGFRETQSGPHSKRPLGVDYLHVAVDDHSRYSYVEALPDERGITTAAFLERALAAFARRGVRVDALLTDNGKNYAVSHAVREVVEAHGLWHRLTRPYRPQTNGKAERFIQILQAEWAYARRYRSNDERLRELPRWLYRYNHRRPHGGIGGAAPASRL